MTDDVQPQRDVDGFYSMETIIKVAETHGYSLLQLPPPILSILESSPATKSLPKHLLHELSCCYEYPLRLFLHDIDARHYTAIHVYEHTIWYFDSLHEKTPIGLTAETLFHLLKKNRHTIYIFSLQ